jgi:putative tryptophan/tyrosine transport system substrate-binding protein
MYFHSVRRREFITLLGGAAAAWPIAARPQQPAMPVVGFLHLGSSVPFSYTASAVREGLKQFGYIEGQNVAIDYRWANNEADRLPDLAADLVRRQVAVILAMGTNLPGLAAKAATTAIPIVFLSGADPVRDGLVAKFDRPGGNVTGVTFRTLELVPKRLDLLHELVPQATTVAHLANPNTPGTAEALQNLLAVVNTLRRQVIVAEARNESDFDSAFARFADGRAGALVVGSSVTAENKARYVVIITRPFVGGAAALTGLIKVYPRMRPLLCRFSAAGDDGLTRRCSGQRLKRGTCASILVYSQRDLSRREFLSALVTVMASNAIPLANCYYDSGAGT